MTALACGLIALMSVAFSTFAARQGFLLGRSTERLAWLEKLTEISESDGKGDWYFAFGEWIHEGYPADSTADRPE